MKWFRCDSALPHHYSIQRVLTALGVEGFGGLVLLWCFSAMWGRDPASPGRCVDSDGDPIPKTALVAASQLTEAQFDELITILLETKGIDRVAWDSNEELNFLGMRSRSDEYRKKVARTKSSGAPSTPRRSVPVGLIKSPPKSPEASESEPVIAAADQSHRLILEAKKITVSPLTRALMEKWNETVTPPLKPVEKLTALRRRLVEKAQKKHTVDELVEAMTLIEASSFCRGEGGSGWKADFNWLLEKNHCETVLSRRYENGRAITTGASTPHRLRDENQNDLRAFARRGALSLAPAAETPDE